MIEEKGKNKNMKFIPLTIFIFLSIFFFIKLSNFEYTESLSSALINKPFPDIILPSLDEKASMDGLIGKKKFAINFFASWCLPCREEHEVLEEFSNEFPIIGIAYKDKMENISNFLKDLGNPYEQVFLDFSGKSAIELGLYGVPETYFIDENGIIKYKHVGPIDRLKFKEYIAKMKNK